MLKGYREWAIARKALLAKLKELDLKRLERSGEFPVGLGEADRLALLLKYLRRAPWAKHGFRRSGRNVPQGSYKTLKHSGVEDSTVDLLSFILGLPFIGLEISPKGEILLQFEADACDNCQVPIVVELDTRFEPYSGWRRRSDMELDLSGRGNAPTAEFIEEQAGRSILAAWEITPEVSYELNFLWSDGRVSTICREGGMITHHILDELKYAAEMAGCASALTVFLGGENYLL